jgi:hypothetical protein
VLQQAESTPDLDEDNCSGCAKESIRSQLGGPQREADILRPSARRADFAKEGNFTSSCTTKRWERAM